MSSIPPSQVGDASRLALARLALDVVSTTPGVAGTDAGPGGRCVTADPPFGVLQGVSVIAQSDGRYEVDLCLVARMVPLLALGDEIRRRLRARAARERLADQLGNVNVEFARALTAGEPTVEVRSAEVAVGAGAVDVTADSPIPPPASTGGQISVPPIPPADPSALPEEQPASSDRPLPPAPSREPQTPLPPTRPGGPSAEEPTDSGSQTPSRDPAGSPIPPPGSTAKTPPSDCEARS